MNVPALNARSFSFATTLYLCFPHGHFLSYRRVFCNCVQFCVLLSYCSSSIHILHLTLRLPCQILFLFRAHSSQSDLLLNATACITDERSCNHLYGGGIAKASFIGVFTLGDPPAFNRGTRAMRRRTKLTLSGVSPHKHIYPLPLPISLSL